ncbi:Glutamate receptor-interacting protein 2 [Holothuria leucospilota]|uniref:Glutamate receptor-interacting protein 2 n=1 Tax=Holothuria leucospilota TaxID=206669 RepID=A0A9Q1HJC4_HOLLE|nr:Glutamate receptor-interacting protein 2 [Holothuria leucospilota]
MRKSVGKNLKRVYGKVTHRPSFLCRNSLPRVQEEGVPPAKVNGDTPLQEKPNQNGMDSIPDECRTVTAIELEKPPGAGFGLTISGGIDKDGRIRVSNMRAGGIAQRSDLLMVGDFITSVGGVQTANLRHDEVIGLLKNAGNRVKLEIEHEVPPIPAANGLSAISKVLELRLVKEELSYGFTVRGGLKPLHSKSRPLIVTHIRPGGPADREGTLKIGDRIVAVNSTPLNHITHSDALMILKQLVGEACFKVEYDVSVMEAVKNATGPLLVEVSKTPGAHLGITLNSTVNNGKLAVMIDVIKPGSIADRCGALHVGDEILTIDGSSTGHMTVPEATQLLGSAAEQVKLEIMPLSQMTPRLTCHNEPKLMMHDVMSHPMGLASYQFPSTGNMHGYHSMPGYAGGLVNRSMSGNLMSSNIMGYKALPQPASTPGSSTLSRKMKNKKSGSTLSLASTINGLTSAHLSHTDTMQVVLYSRLADFGITLQGSVFATEALGSPAVIGFIEPGGKADRCGVLQPGDRILAINGRYTEEMTTDEASHMLKESCQQCVLDIEFDIAETVVPSSGVFNVKLPVGEAGLGLTLTSPRGRHMGDGLMISQVKKGSIAHRSGTLEPGDNLLAIDDIHIDSFSVDEAIHLLRQADDVVKLRVKKDEAYSDEPSVSGAISYSVELVRHGGPLGITISGTEERFDPVIISELTEGGLAERTGAIHVGDRLLAINAVSLRGKTLSEAIRLLQTAGDVVILKVSKQERPFRGSYNDLGMTGRSLEHDGRRSRGVSPSRFESLPPRFRSYSTDQPGTPLISGERLRYDNWEESGLDTGYQSHYTHHSRSMSPATARSRSRTSSMSPTRSRSRRHTSVSPSRRSNRGRHSRRPSYSGSQYDMSDEEIEQAVLPIEYRDPYRPYDGSRVEYDEGYVSSLRRNHRLPPEERVDRMDRPVDGYGHSPYNSLQMHSTNGMPTSGSMPMNMNGADAGNSVTTNGSIGRYRKRRDQSMDRLNGSLSGSQSATPPPGHEVLNKPTYSDPESKEMSSSSRVDRLANRMDSISLRSLDDTKQQSDSDGAPAPIELLRVTLYKDSDVEDFGFSVSDGITEKGVFVNTIRPGGPAARQGNVKPYDRVLQVNQTRTRSFDCCMVVPLIAASGNKLDLVLSRNPLAQLQLGPPSDDLGASSPKSTDNDPHDSNDSSQVSM